MNKSEERDTLHEDEEADCSASSPQLHPLEIRCAELTDELDVVNREMFQLRERERALVAELDRSRLELERIKPPTAHMTNLKDFIASQQQQRAERVERANRALGIGITAEVLSGKSPLDQAMSKKNPRGHQRPQRDMKAS